MAEEELKPFDMKKKKKKKKTGFDPDALDSGDIGNDTSTKVEELPPDTTDTTEQTQEKSIEEDFSLEFGGLKKKKKKKKPTFEMDEMKEALPEEPQQEEEEPKEEDTTQTDVTLGENELSLTKKKKRRKKPLDIDDIAKDDADAGIDQFDAVDTDKKSHKGKAWIGSDRDYSYDELLTRVFDIMREKNPEMVAGEKKKIVMRPPQVFRAGARRTSFANFSEISRMLHRQSKHLLAFIFAELGTSGSVDGTNQLIIRGRFNQKQIENVLRRYIKEYVTCHTCKSPDTLLQKEERLFFLQCETCGSRCSVASIKSGFQAVTGRRAAMRANAQ